MKKQIQESFLCNAGNEALSWLTSSNNKRYELRVDLSDFNGTGRYAIYSEFKIASAGRQYQMVSLGQYSGNAGILQNDACCYWLHKRKRTSITQQHETKSQNPFTLLNTC